MPQMAPLSWLSLFIMFIVIYLMFNTLNYFSFNYMPKTFLINKKMKKNSWKW
uniref:ATP synthase complex subunit 8 n=1 Tax=Tetartopeus terminatum TaxID=879056 RepID=A0A0S2M937_TETTM|nr:ATP synthase F0 subunit 8 [Tetartopeus terminatus]ALO71202.1 ATP synthase F0 subunit 8 [Tetartopeus terminatus]